MINTFSTATEMMSALQNKEISVVELLDMYLTRIEQGCGTPLKHLKHTQME